MPGSRQAHELAAGRLVYGAGEGPKRPVGAKVRIQKHDQILRSHFGADDAPALPGFDAFLRRSRDAEQPREALFHHALLNVRSLEPEDYDQLVNG